MDTKKPDIFDFNIVDTIWDDRFEIVKKWRWNNDIFAPKQKDGEDYPNRDIVKYWFEVQKEELINVLQWGEYENAIIFITWLRKLMRDGIEWYLASRLIELHPILKWWPIYMDYKIAWYTIPMEISYDPEHWLATSVAQRLSNVFWMLDISSFDEELSKSYNYAMPIHYHLSCIVYNQNYEPILDASKHRMPQYIKAQLDKNTYFMNAMQLLPTDWQDQFNNQFKDALLDNIKNRIKK